MILSVPFRNQSENLTNLKGALGPRPAAGRRDRSPGRGGQRQGQPGSLGVWQGSAAQQARRWLPGGVRVVAAFHTVSAALLEDLDHELDEDVLICGDGAEDKAGGRRADRSIDGLRPVDCGPLEMARILEQLTPLIISINVRHKVRAGIKITGL